MTAQNPSFDSGHAAPREQLRTMLEGYQISQLVHVAAKLGIADMLKDGPKTTDELAEATGAHAQTLYRVLRTLASIGVFAENDDERFHLSPLAEPLQSDYPGGLHYSALLTGDDVHWTAWGNLYRSVMTGKNAFLLTHGLSRNEYYQRHPEAYEHYHRRMVTRDLAVLPGVISAYDFSGISKLVDVGGGHGQYVTAIVKRYPRMQGVIFDRLSAEEGATAKIRGEGLEDRCVFIGGSFFGSVPSGDACLVKSIIMDYPDRDAVTILENCRNVVGPAGKVIVIERLPRGTPNMFMDLMMVVISDGHLRTEEEHRSLLNAAGLKLTRVISTPSQYTILESIPA